MKQWIFRLLGKGPEAVIVTFCTGDPELCRRMAEEVRSLVPDRRHFLATPDLSWPRKKVVLEYEGDHHRSDKRQWHIDLERYATLQDAGFTVVRAAAPDLRDPARIIARLRRLLNP